MRPLLLCLVIFSFGNFSYAGRIEVSADDIKVDGVELPYLYGAETQYFRARGGSERNVDRGKVMALWGKLLDRVQEARMNLVSIYIPWDFHEPKEGVYDFDGKLDQDNDGKPDYPSRDLKSYFKLLESRGIKQVMLRPGPYINAEWGPVGFGAIPLWFLQKYPDALAVTQTPNKPKTAAFASSIYREHVRKWFRSLYQNVLKDYIGKGKMGVFLQIDNETNYFWDSVYERDYSALSVVRYQGLLQQKYQSVARLNQLYGSRVVQFNQVVPPRNRNDVTYRSPQWHYDWYEFHDVEIREYYRFLRQAWKDAGLDDSQVLVTSCDSFNALGQGLLPRLDYRQKDRLTLSTMNIYPKTEGEAALPTLYTPMKAAHDASLVANSHQQFWGALGNWVMSTETVGGWFAPVAVTNNTRQHTYATLLGSDVKAQTIYYFHEGFNWTGKEANDTELHFDAPLDKDLNPQPAFPLLVSLGNVLAGGLNQRLMMTNRVTAPVLVAHDSFAQYPVPGDVDALTAASTDSASIFGALREAGAFPEAAYIDAMNSKELLSKYRFIAYANPGYITMETKVKLAAFLQGGGTVVVFGGLKPQLPNFKRLFHFPVNFLNKWNTPAYVGDKNATTALATLRGLLKEANIALPVSAVAADAQPYLHTWIRSPRDSGTSLLFVENFLNKPRSAKVSFGPLPQSIPKIFRVVHRWAPTDSRFAEVRGTQEKGLELPVSSDGVDIWEVIPE